MDSRVLATSRSVNSDPERMDWFLQLAYSHLANSDKFKQVTIKKVNNKRCIHRHDAFMIFAWTFRLDREKSKKLITDLEMAGYVKNSLYGILLLKEDYHT